MNEACGKLILMVFGVGLVLALCGSPLPAEADTDLQKGSAADVKKAKALCEQALSTEDLSEKERLYLEAIKLWPAFAQAHNNLGDVYEEQGRFEEAIKEYEVASALAPSAPYPYFGLGDVYFTLGKYKLAIPYYKKGLKIQPNDKASLERLKLSKAVTTKILFPFDSYELTATAIRQLKVIAAALSSAKLKDSVFQVQGHTDSIGSENYNLHLSKTRAKIVRNYLVEKRAIAADRLTAKGYGEDRPVASNETREGTQMNRRVEIQKIGMRTGNITVINRPTLLEKLETR